MRKPPQAPRSPMLDLDRSEVARIADAFDALAERYGSRKNAAAETGICLTQFHKFGQRKGAAVISQELLVRVASKFDLTWQDIIAGRGPRPSSDVRLKVPVHRASR